MITVAKRYADALFQLGKEKSTLDQFVEELQLFVKSFKENEQFVHIS